MTTDVLIVGAGPVGLTAALLCARQGLRVEVIEKRTAPETTPRAVALDDEALRIWQSCGLEEELRSEWEGGDPGQAICTYVSDRGIAFLRIRQRLSDLGFPHAVVIHQGRIEERLVCAALRHHSIRVRWGCQIEHLHQGDGEVTVQGTDREGQPLCSSGSWVIACDGGGSAVRRELGIPMTGKALPRPWLVANLLDNGEPGHVHIRCSAKNAAVTVPIPHGIRRVEVELEAGDQGDWLTDEHQVRRTLRRGWEDAASAEILSVALCRFKSSLAMRWREGRVFLVGDAAHIMPPFAGQGLGAGLRDVANLCFKIAGVSQGWLGEQVLDTYEVERRPHVMRMARLACRLGRVMSPRSRVEAAIVQRMLMFIGAIPLIGNNWLLRGPSIRPSPRRGFFLPMGEGGHYLPQPIVVTPDDRKVRLDELLGQRMTWIVLGGGTAPRLDRPLLQPADTVIGEGRDFRDPEQVLRRRFGRGSLILVRPDRVVYSHFRSSGDVRRFTCVSDAIAVRQVREVASAPLPELSPRCPGVSPTVPTRRSRFARRSATIKVPTSTSS